MQYLFFLLLPWTLFALNIEINSDNFHKFNREISTDAQIQKLIAEQKVSLATLQKGTDEESDNSLQRAALQREYAQLKMLLVYLKPSTTESEFTPEIREALYKKYASKKEEFTFIYKLTYPTQGTIRGDALFEMLQKKISLHILEKYGISNIDEKAQLTDKDFSTTTQEYTLGTTEANPQNNFDNPYRFQTDKTSRSGVVSFYFYPFVMIKQNSKRLQDAEIQDKSTAYESEFTQINNPSDIEKINFELQPKDKENIRLFLSSYHQEKMLNLSQESNSISQKSLKYSQIAHILFGKYPQCKTLADLDKTIQTKRDSLTTLNKHKTYTYFINLSNDDDLEYVLLPAFRKLSKYLHRDTQVNSLEDKQTLRNDSFSKETTNSALVPIIKNVSLKIYIKDDGSLGLYAHTDVSFEESDVCGQYIKGLSPDRLYGVRFIQLKYKGKIVEVSQTEITNRLFFKILPRVKRDKQCKTTQGKNRPVNCLSYKDLDLLLQKLNKQSKKYHYRFFTCAESLFFASCGDKQKYCWGNTPEYSPYEFLPESRYDITMHPVAQKHANGLNLYDFCGNAKEYCLDKHGWYKAFGVQLPDLHSKIFRHAYTDTTTIRLVREKK